jgi:membrane protease YdiL (CAAX protease family)
MDIYHEKATERPVTFCVVLLLLSVLFGMVFAALTGTLIGVSFFDPLPQLVGKLVVTGFLLWFLRCFGWVRGAGVSRLGSWGAWAFTLVVAVYLYLVNLYAFFGELRLGVPLAEVFQSSQWVMFPYALFEEVLFRGVILYALVRVWGDSRRGLVMSAMVSALLFGLLHLLNIFSGDVGEVLMTTLASFFSGIWWAAMVLRWKSIWPVVVLHGFGNFVVNLKAEFTPWFQAEPSDFWFLILLKLPLVIWGLWTLLRIETEAVVPEAA